MDRKIGLPPSGSTMGNNALRIKNKLFAASTMTNLQPHSPAASNAAPNSAAQNCAVRHSLVSRRECADAAHIITLIRQNKMRAVDVFAARVLAAKPRWRCSEILQLAADQQGVREPNRGNLRPSLERASELGPAKRSCLSLPSDVARRKSAQTRREQLTLQCFLPGPLHEQRIAHTPAAHPQTVLRPRARRPRQFQILAGMRAHRTRQVSGCWRARF